MKLKPLSTTPTESNKTEQVVIAKLLKLLTQYKKDKNSLDKVFLYVHKLSKQKEVILSPKLQIEIQELEVLEETIDTGKITVDNQHIIKTVVEDIIVTIKSIEKSVNKK